MNAFSQKLSLIEESDTCRLQLRTLQVNLGNLCNQRCIHCHVDAGPQGKNIMTKRIMDDVLRFLSCDGALTLDITGGAPEMNPHFDYFVSAAKKFVPQILVRTNLTVIFEPGKEYLAAFFKENQIYLVCSLPCYTVVNVDQQRGEGVFVKSIKALRILNKQGYARKPELKMDLVYNPVGAFLPAKEKDLEKDYKRILGQEFDVDFNRLIAITNAPINRFKDFLKQSRQYEKYIDILEDNFNADVVENIMCRRLLSVGWDGTLYDCDFNQSQGMAICDENNNNLHVGSVRPHDFEGRKISFDEHCFCCTAGSGSSCQGALETRGE